MKGALGLRPVFHHHEDRVRAHVQPCWLALLLLRVVENATDDGWRNVRDIPVRMHRGSSPARTGRSRNAPPLTAGQTSILTALELPEPPRFLDFTVPSD